MEIAWQVYDEKGCVIPRTDRYIKWNRGEEIEYSAKAVGILWAKYCQMLVSSLDYKARIEMRNKYNKLFRTYVRLNWEADPAYPGYYERRISPCGQFRTNVEETGVITLRCK